MGQMGEAWVLSFKIACVALEAQHLVLPKQCCKEYGMVHGSPNSVAESMAHGSPNSVADEEITVMHLRFGFQSWLERIALGCGEGTTLQ